MSVAGHSVVEQELVSSLCRYIGLSALSGAFTLGVSLVGERTIRGSALKADDLFLPQSLVCCLSRRAISLLRPI